jgi:TonB family protein
VKLLRYVVPICITLPYVAFADTTPPTLKTFVSAEYPPAALAAGIEGEVEFNLTIAANGAVAIISITKSAGFGFDEAALQAVRRFIFTPALQNGAPVAAQIQYRYKFQLEKLGRKASPLSAPLDSGNGKALQENLGEVASLSLPMTPITGEVLEKGSRNHLINTELFFFNKEGVIVYQASVNERGAFSLDVLPGEYKVRVIADGFITFDSTQNIPAGGSISLVLRLVPSFQREEYGLIVRGEEQAEAINRHEVSAEELSKMPGTQGDVLKGLQNLPGIARVPLNSSTIAVRGSSPEDTQTFLDGMPIPVLYHFSGITAVIPGSLLSQVNYTPGVYSVRFGRSTGGLIEAETTTKAPEKLKGTADIDVFDSGVFVQGPIGDSKASFALGARRSYIDAFLPTFVESDELSLTIAPHFWDYQAKLSGPVGKGQAQLLAFGSQDRVELAIDSPTAGTQFQSTLTRFHRLQGTWRQETKSGLTRRVSASIGTTNVSGETQDNAFHIEVLLGTARIDWASQPHNKLQLRYGADLQVDHFTRQERLPSEFSGFLETKQELSYPDAGLYTELTWKPIDALTITPGLRGDYFGGSGSLTLDPRIFLRWKLNEKIVLKSGIGMFHKDPQPFELDPNIGDPNLRTEEATQATVGVERLFSNNAQLEASVYAKYMSQLVVESPPGESREEILSNGGEGRAYGAELLLRAPPSKRFFGWVAYSLSRAERRDDNVFVPFDFDQTHVLTTLGSYKLRPDWSVGTRLRYATGNPTTDVTGSVFDTDRGVYLPLKGPKNQDRLPAFHQLDLRMDRTFRLKNASILTYVEVLNVYNRRNPESTSFNFDFTRQQFFQGLPILPMIGIQGSF